MPYCYDCGAQLQPGDRTLCVQCRARLHADRWLPPFQQSLTPGHFLGCRCVPCLLPALPSGWMAHYEPDIESWSYVNQSTGQRRLTHPALPRAGLPPPPPVPAFGSIVPQTVQGRQLPANVHASKPSTASVSNLKGKEVASKQEPSQSTSTTPAVPNEPRAILRPPVGAGPSSLRWREADHSAAQDDAPPQGSRKRSASPQDIPTKRTCATNNSTVGSSELLRPRSPVKPAAFAEDTDDDLTDLGDDDEVKFSLPCRRCRGIHSDFRAWGHNYAQCPSHTPAKQRRLLQELEVYQSGLTAQQPHAKEEDEEDGGLPNLGEQSRIREAFVGFGNTRLPSPIECKAGLRDGPQPEVMNWMDRRLPDPRIPFDPGTLPEFMYNQAVTQHLSDLRNG